ncbi:MAG: hypothetical protein CR974_00560 [Gammaproteobacteria bacterium]|nr:MAG: hypothetical protein CR974_00560 [Gammaproteobacteria bacterium]
MSKIKKVLIVDDSKLARLTLERLLNSQGMTVLSAHSVDSALRILSMESVDAIFLDVQMPEKNGFDGLELLKADEELRHIPVSMYSGDLSQEAQKEAINRGAQAYLFKPANLETVKHVLEALERNIIAEDMQQYAPAEETVETDDNIVANAAAAIADNTAVIALKRQSKQCQAQIEKHQKALLALDGRTRNLARLLNQEKKEIEGAHSSFAEHVVHFEQELDSLRRNHKHSQHDELLHKRSENDIRGELKKVRDNLRMTLTVAVIAVIFGIFSTLLATFLYVSHY